MNGAKLLLRAYYSQASGGQVSDFAQIASSTGRRPANNVDEAGASSHPDGIK
ncbi:hypothetical protein J2Y45_006607 [Dyadobacter sp. BE34]|uniref:Uncharacterized protein n=1 Tax=Dyadobacter fermentans TaxID=94254 RepID=A0ABU1R815_9BACT|nr:MULTISPECIES: hypothetical protein [Dyadobacter]MDR6809536.1 hypothetical protein [Dyadobacter fermentans]MDR7047207.1 hypothetical protein [Dyadobacter sp. BE242]MDR7201443.1 hypothetical protein [Dyadobacter sp. BE34]MDR7219313.1 hypothetical protein [Dyadobacter sp. BE31]MDR7267079.1 hypothetical protein [Dyadobacter sp. BE32]